MIYDVSIYEPIHPGWSADSVTVSADSIVFTSDGAPLTPASEVNDAIVNANFIYAEIVEPVARLWSADATTITADSDVYRADGSPAEAARDTADAQVIAAELPIGGGGYVARAPKRWVYGYGYGVLPQLTGEAHGFIGYFGSGASKLPLTGKALGQVDDFTNPEVLILLALAA